MARRRKSDLDKSLDLIALMPWQVTLPLAPVAFVLLHLLASAKPVTPVNATELGNTIVVQFIITAAMIGQYLLPILLLAGAVANYLSRRRRSQNYELALSRGTQQSLLDMSWQEFEGLVAQYFQRKGYEVKVLGGAGADGGVDVELRQGTELALVQCKQWRATRVGVDVVRQLYGVMAARNASTGYVVTSADFTPDAQKFVSGLNIHLLNGEQLIRHMRKASLSMSQREPSRSVVEAPRCPQCQTIMTKRSAKKGVNVGQSFWGCQRFPACRGTRPV